MAEKKSTNGGKIAMPGHVLLIEDEPNIIEAITYLLRQDGWTVTTHSDGANAVEKVRAAQPDVVILDVMLPGRSGFEILKEIRSFHDMDALPVLMLTAKGQEKDRNDARAFGASRFMTKPFSNADMVAAVRDLAR